MQSQDSLERLQESLACAEAKVEETKHVLRDREKALGSCVVNKLLGSFVLNITYSNRKN
jgi:hypothetical protein